MAQVAIRVQKAIQNIGNVELARRAGVNRVTVHSWQTGSRNVSAETARRIEDALLRNGTADVPRQDNDAA